MQSSGLALRKVKDTCPQAHARHKAHMHSFDMDFCQRGSSLPLPTPATTAVVGSRLAPRPGLQCATAPQLLVRETRARSASAARAQTFERRSHATPYT